MKNNFIAVISMTIWISLSEFLRNQILFLSHWEDLYRNLGLTFPSRPINGALWGLWSLLLAVSIFYLAKKFSFQNTVTIAWLMGFVMMWVVIGNLGVLPIKLLLFAVPLSLLEVIGAVFIVKKMTKSRTD